MSHQYCRCCTPSRAQSHEAHLVGTIRPTMLVSHPPFSRNLFLQERDHLTLPEYLQGGSLPGPDPRCALPPVEISSLENESYRNRELGYQQ